jgi:hypothetical protein
MRRFYSTAAVVVVFLFRLTVKDGREHDVCGGGKNCAMLCCRQQPRSHAVSDAGKRLQRSREWRQPRLHPANNGKQPAGIPSHWARGKAQTSLGSLKRTRDHRVAALVSLHGRRKLYSAFGTRQGQQLTAVGAHAIPRFDLRNQTKKSNTRTCRASHEDRQIKTRKRKPVSA